MFGLKQTKSGTCPALLYILWKDIKHQAIWSREDQIYTRKSTKKKQKQNVNCIVKVEYQVVST